MIAVYAGTFDPPTNGHRDVIVRASKVFEELAVGIGTGSGKTPLFIGGERLDLMRHICLDLPNVKVTLFQGLLVDFCRSIKAGVIVRGLRTVTDFEAELAMAHTNKVLAPEIDTFFLGATTNDSFVSSSMVREVARYNGDISKFVDPMVASALMRKLRG